MDCAIALFTYATALDTVTNTKQSLNRHKNSKSESPRMGEPVDQKSLYRRLRLKKGRIARKFGNTYIRTLRAKYGEEFAPGERAERKLVDVLDHLDDQSLARLIEELSGHQTR
jgi:hypothetical protein